MRKELITILISVFAVQFVFGQWSELSVPGGQWYNGIHFVNTDIGWAVGDDGVIIKTTDGGETWNSQTSGTTENLQEVYFLNQNNGWAIGAWNNIGNTLLKTVDGGSTWQLIDPDPATHRYYEDIQFVDANNGWIVGASCKILHTSDGGLNWTTQSVGTTNPTLQSVFFINVTTGWVSSSDGRIWKTTDSGTNWDLQSTPTSTLADPLYDVFFLDANKGWACGDNGVVLATSNGGTTWDQIATNVVGNNCQIVSIYFTNASVGFAANGCWDQVIKTIDGGNTWTSTTTGVGFGEKIFFISANTGWCAGSSGIVKTTNGGNPTTGITEEISKNNIFVYPSPASSILSISDTEKQIRNLEVYNYEGKKIFSSSKPLSDKIDISQIPTGFYVVKISSKDETIAIQKLIIAR